MKNILIVLMFLNIILCADMIKDAKKACDGGDPGACNYLGESYSTQDNNIAERFYKKACDGGHAKGCNSLGEMYENDNKFDLAIILYKKACDGSNGKACLRLGFIYEKKLTANATILKAKEFYKQACTLGNFEGCSAYSQIEDK